MKLYVLVPRGDLNFAKKVQEAGATPLMTETREVDGHPIAHGRTGGETVAIVKEHVARGKQPLARGGLDRATARAALDAGAVGFVFDAALWLHPESPLAQAEKDAIRRLQMGDFAAGGVATLPSGLAVGRDALMAPFLLRRAPTLAGAIGLLREELGAPGVVNSPGVAPDANTRTREHANAVSAAPVQVAPTPAPASQPTAAPSPAAGANHEEVLRTVVALVSEKTGYPADVLDPTLDMEADLGIDTVKQAELFGELRAKFNVPRDDSLKLKDFPTLEKVAHYMSSRGQGGAPPASAPQPAPVPQPAPAPTAQPQAPKAQEAPKALAAAPAAAGAAFETRPQEDAVAIIGVGAVLPKANDAKQFWQNVVGKVNGIIEVPRERWDPAIHYDPDPATQDKTYAKIGGFVTDFKFDPMRFRIPPNTAKALDPVQQMALTAAAEALADAGYDRKEFDRARCAVILGNSLGGELKDETNKRMHLSEFAAALRASTNSEEALAALAQTEAQLRRDLPAITEDSMPGELSNVIAGRLANVLNLGGKNLTTDAACASSHAALDTAVKAILGGEADMVLCGGADRSMDPATYVKFCKIGALSATGSTPFDARANGFVMGEGVAILLLKRLSDAIRDGDNIYAVVRGMGSSSDGKGKGITAPNPVGQKLAVKRALDVAELAPKWVQLVEAHGTSTKVGDVVEVESVAELYKGLPAGSVALGSVKSQIGHLKSAAGAAGILKAALALKTNTLPPSINFETPNPNIDWANIPFYVNTEAKPWPAPPSGEPRRAAVSAFGFGGTNFHVVLEEYVPAYHRDHRAALAAQSAAAPVPRAPVVESEPVEPTPPGEVVIIAADAPEALIAEIGNAAQTAARATTLAGAAMRVRTPRAHEKRHRLAFGAPDRATLVQGLQTAAELLPDPKKRVALPLKVKGASYGEGARAPGKVAFLFPGQGSQYANMCALLAQRYPVVRQTFEEADAVLEPLIGRKLTSLIFVTNPEDTEAMKRAEEALRQTEVTQPAMLAADVAIFRLLGEHGIKPDMVAGHSLGEYAALVASGVLSFKDALTAVSARGKEMANVHVEDKGLMASFSAGPDDVERVLSQVDGYVVAANKNCPVQTVIAGGTQAVKQACELAQQQGIQVVPLNVSAAFHTSIVAPASEPLRRVLSRLDFHAPQIPVYTNVDATPYPADPDAARDILAKQVAAPVEWIAELNALYDAGARVFIEVGPKRALAAFVDATLGKKDGVVSLLTNHPKRGDLPSFFDTLARLAALGFELNLPSAPAPAAVGPVAPPASASAPAYAPRPTLAPSGDAEYDAFRQAVQPAIDAALAQGFTQYRDEMKRLREASSAFERYGLVPCDIVVSGASMGLPGQARRVFDDSNFERLFNGENRIDRLDESWADRFLEKDIVRLVKDGGEPRMEAVKDAHDVLRLAGRKGDIDVERDYHVDKKLAKTLDITSKLAIAAAYEALHDAGIPMVRETVVTKSGKTLPGNFTLPQHLQNDTGIVFASAFPGYDNLVKEVSAQLARKYSRATLTELDGLYHEMLEAVPAERRGRLSRFYAEHAHKLHAIAGDEQEMATFNRHFLFSVLSMGHAELAETIHARGPNTQVNAACASTTQAIAVAEDWMRTGRARRVIVVGADDVTSDNLLEWIGSGFLTSGAATTAANVEEGALPFDKRRHGMIIGMGAVGLVLERKEDVDERGMTPVARLVATRIVNSAYHGSRLHVDHISGETRALVEVAAKRVGATPESLASQTLFVSHETYTPARGGSASAEAGALRAAFGNAASQVLITNTKGFTGHAMGAGLEDALAVKALQFNRAPPIANLRDVDDEFADLQLARGGATSGRRYAMRFSAGFGSQLALAFFEKMADGAQRIVNAGAYQSFLDRCAGSANAKAERVGRVLRITSTTAPATPPGTVMAPARAVTVPVAVASATAGTKPDVLAQVTALVAEKTGYPAEMLDPSLDMEADLGIDTVKQAELFGELRARFDVPRDDTLSLKDYNTLRKVADYMSRASPVQAPSAPMAPPAPAPDAAPSGALEVLPRVQALIAQRTGYPPEMLDPTLDMEADLGIDTVKQAEIFGEVRETFGIPRIEGINLKDYATIEKVAQFVQQYAGQTTTPATAPATTPAATPEDVGAPLTAQRAGALTRRVPRVADAPAKGAATRRAYVVGDGMLVAALRDTFPGDSGEVAIYEGDARGLFHFARSRAADLESGALGILALTHLGGRQGIDHAKNPEHGGVTGLAKSLAQEFPKSFVRALDLDPDEPADVRVQHVAEELAVEHAPVEVGRTARGRIVVRTVEAGETTNALPQLPDRAVIVATGGARGITAAVLTALAPQKPTLILLGRTAAPRDSDADLDDAGIQRLKEKAMEELRAEGHKVTPVAIEKRVAPARARAEIARNVRAMREAGATVEYVQVDATDAGALERAVADVRARHGGIHGVLHAAGVEESKRLADKDEGAFDRAWRPKAEAALALARITQKDKLSFFVMFGSVAGRYGNAAQADYSAANDALAKLARALRDRGVGATVMCWGPWGETGMATRGSTLTVLKSVGVEPITTSEGVSAFLSELARLDEAEVVLAKSLGDLEKQPSVPVVRSMTRTLMASDPALDHHRVDGVPYLAGVSGIQAMLDAAPGRVTGLEDVHFAYPVKLLRDKPVDITVRVDAAQVATITSVPPGPVPQERTHFTATLVTHEMPTPVPKSSVGGTTWAYDKIYPPFFHGPAFQVLGGALRVGPDAIEVQGRGPAPGITSLAATIEGAFQSLGLWGLAVGRVMALPERVLRVTLAGGYDPARTTYRVTGAHVRGATDADDPKNAVEPARVWGDVECVVGDRVVASLQGVALIVTGASPLEDAPQVWNAIPASVGNVELVQVPVDDARALLARPELLSTWLSDAERDALAQFHVEKRRDEWTAATLAGKCALRNAGDARAWRAIEVLRGEDGAPLDHGDKGLTLSHAGGVAIARAFDARTERVGIDVERVDARAATFEEEAFTASERDGFPASGPERAASVTLAWAAKEAILKALGTGLSVPLHDVRLRLSGKGAEVELSGAAKERFSKLNGQALSVDARREGDLVLAVARLRLG